MIKILIFTVFIQLVVFSCKQRDVIPFENIPEDFEVLNQVLENHSKYKVQILYTQIDRDSKNKAQLWDFDLFVNDETYFYPASTVKLPIAILALEWLNEQNIGGLNADAIMLTDSVRGSQVPARYDSTAANLKPSIRQYIKKILLVSDNDAYNRLYELLGQDYINAKLREKGLYHTVINHRLSMPMEDEENRHFNPIQFVDTSGYVVHEIPARYSEQVYVNNLSPTIGKAYYHQGELVEKPMDFTFKNKFSLSNFHGVIKRIVFPASFSEEQQFKITAEDRNFLLKYMSMLPGESDIRAYHAEEYYDSYSKFYKFGTQRKPIPDNFRIFNKTGNAYGHMLDGSYFVDFENGVEFFVSAVIYTNENETLNDDLYEYEEVAYPFFAELGNYLYELELDRKRGRSPDLKEFVFEY